MTHCAPGKDSVQVRVTKVQLNEIQAKACLYKIPVSCTQNLALALINPGLEAKA